MLGDIHQEFGLLKVFDSERVGHFRHGLLGERRYVPAQHQYCIRHLFVLHSISQDFDRLHAHLFILGEENKQLVRIIVRLFLLKKLELVRLLARAMAFPKSAHSPPK